MNGHNNNVEKAGKVNNIMKLYKRNIIYLQKGTYKQWKKNN